MRQQCGFLMAGTGLLAVFAASAQAHHSDALFDHEHPVVATGTVKAFLWEQPHVWIYLLVPDGKGGADEWRIEGPSISTIGRQGWTQTSIVPGEKIHAMIFPDKTGAHHGRFNTVSLDDGTVIGAQRPR